MFIHQPAGDFMAGYRKLEAAFTALAEKYGKSNIQIILRWHVQMGNQIIPGSINPGNVHEI